MSFKNKVDLTWCWNHLKSMDKSVPLV